MKRLAVPFLKYVLGPLLVAIFSFYVGQKNESQNNKGYEVLAKAVNVELQATLEHIDARLDGLETRTLRLENNLLVFHRVPSTQPVVEPPPMPLKPAVPAKAPAVVPPPTKAPAAPVKVAPPAKVDTAPGKIVVAPKPPARPAQRMPIRVPPRLKDF